jgi:hypothetical protein
MDSDHFELFCGLLDNEIEAWSHRAALILNSKAREIVFQPILGFGQLSISASETTIWRACRERVGVPSRAHLFHLPTRPVLGKCFSMSINLSRASRPSIRSHLSVTGKSNTLLIFSLSYPTDLSSKRSHLWRGWSVSSASDNSSRGAFLCG